MVEWRVSAESDTIESIYLIMLHVFFLFCQLYFSDFSLYFFDNFDFLSEYISPVASVRKVGGWCGVPNPILLETRRNDQTTNYATTLTTPYCFRDLQKWPLSIIAKQDRCILNT